MTNKNNILTTFSKILLLILISFIADPTFGQGMKGKIKSFRDSYFSVHEIYGKIKKGTKLNDSVSHDQIVSFDQNGNVTEAIDYNFDGTIFCKYIGRNDYKDNNIESIYVRFDSKLIIEKKSFLLASVKYPSGEMCEMAYKNDLKGRPIEETIFDLMGSVLFTIIIKRDENGNSLEYNFSDGVVYLFKYDNHGNRVELIYRSSTGKTSITTYKNDASGNMIEENINDFFKSSYKFHDEHNTYRYLYDKQGNWIERTDYEHDIPQRIVVRAIEYLSD